MPGPPPYAEFYDVDDPEEVKVAEINAYLAERKASGQKVLNYEEMKKLDHALNAGFITSRSNGRILHPPLYDPVPTSESDSLKSSRGTAPAGPKISAGESSKSADVDHPLAWIKTQLRPTTSMKRTAPAGSSSLSAPQEKAKAPALPKQAPVPSADKSIDGDEIFDADFNKILQWQFQKWAKNQKAGVDVVPAHQNDNLENTMNTRHISGSDTTSTKSFGSASGSNNYQGARKTDAYQPSAEKLKRLRPETIEFVKAMAEARRQKEARAKSPAENGSAMGKDDSKDEQSNGSQKRGLTPRERRKERRAHLQRSANTANTEEMTSVSEESKEGVQQPVAEEDPSKDIPTRTYEYKGAQTVIEEIVEKKEPTALETEHQESLPSTKQDEPERAAFPGTYAYRPAPTAAEEEILQMELELAHAEENGKEPVIEDIQQEESNAPTDNGKGKERVIKAEAHIEPTAATTMAVKTNEVAGTDGKQTLTTFLVKDANTSDMQLSRVRALTHALIEQASGLESTILKSNILKLALEIKVLVDEKVGQERLVMEALQKMARVKPMSALAPVMEQPDEEVDIDDDVDNKQVTHEGSSKEMPQAPVKGMSKKARAKAKKAAKRAGGS